MFFLMDHHSLMFCSKYAIFETHFYKISKNTALKGISPHCYKTDYHSLFPTLWISIFFYFFWKPAFDLVWPIISSNDISNQRYIPYTTSYGCLSIHATNIILVYFPQYEFPYFLPLLKTSFWPCVTYNDLQWHR